MGKTRGDDRVDRGIILLCSAFSALLLLGLLPVAISRYGSTPDNARFFMGFFLIFGWLVIFGGLMWAYQHPLMAFMRQYASRPKTGFVAFSILLACLEEALACLATNLHGPFGDPTGRVYITASSNYLDLIFFHSVIVIVPLLVVWSWTLARYRFTGTRLLLLFGAQGALAEVVFAGMQPALFPTWLLVYGLMVWLPYQAFQPALDRARARRTPGLLAHLLFPLLAQLGGVLFTLVFLLISHGLIKHPLSHFPPSHG